MTRSPEVVHRAGEPTDAGQCCDLCGALLVSPDGPPYPAGTRVVQARVGSRPDDDDPETLATWATSRPATCLRALGHPW